MMPVLVDTHVALWVVTGRALSVRARQHLLEPGAALFVSAATIWEIAIKYPLKRGLPGDMPVSGRESSTLFASAGFEILPVTAAHAAAVDDLPPLHGDPFDRMLIAQSKAEPMRLLTADVQLAAYGELVTVV